jgi:hypothetical protein
MAVATGTAILGAAAIGALASRGQGGSSGSQTQYRDIGKANANESAADQSVMEQLRQLQQFQGVGPGQADVAGGYQAQNQLAQMLQQYSQGGYSPNEQDQLTARNQLAPQFEQARQNNVVANQQFRQQAAVSGRGPMDFAFTNRLNQNMGNQMNMLAAQQSQIAAQQPMQRLGFMQDYATLKSGLASQAMQNRLAIANLGSSIRDSERNLRLGAATTTTNTSGSSGNETSNMLMGGLAGAGMGMQLANGFGGMGGGAAAPSPWDSAQASSSLGNLIGSQGNAGSSYSYGGGARSPMSIVPAPRSYGGGSSSWGASVPSFLNPATGYSASQPMNLYQGIPGFGR